jgi:hypothetical protein
MRRIVLVVTDGLRPDAITTSRMPSLDGLSREYTRADRARTVRPSATVAALASLATGVGPGSHGLVEPGLQFLTRLSGLKPVARELARNGCSTAVVGGTLAPAARAVTWALAAAAGARCLLGGGARARDIAERASDTIAEGRDGLVMVYLPDCDVSGHAHGWMSEPYLDAAREVDAAIGVLSRWTDQALLVILADHGGGGVVPTCHDQPHPVNDHIPLILAGPSVRRRHVIRRHTSILDVPPTLLWAAGAPVPECYEGRVLRDAFVRVGPAVETGAVAA